MMLSFARRALDRGLEINERLAASASNGFDWLFNRSQLVKSGQTPFDLIHQGDLMSVRYYSLEGDSEIELVDGSTLPIRKRKYPVPLVLVPPLGVTTEVFDLMPNRSLVRYMTARGFKVYLICWGKPTREHAHLRMLDYGDTMMAEALSVVSRHSGSDEVSLMGWCMGGLISLVHAGLDETTDVRNIVTVASPIDMRGGGIVAGAAQALNTPARLIRKYTDFRLHALDPKKLHVPGWATTLAFKMTDPIGSITTYWDLITRLWDREFVETHSTTSDYLNNMLAYPAGMVRDMTVGMMVENRLINGDVELGGKCSRMSNIKVPILVFAGERDALIAPSTARVSLELVASTDKRFEVAPGGHMGVILGSTAQRVVWANTADWLAERSQASAPRLAAAKQRVSKPPTKKASTPKGVKAAAKAPARSSKAKPAASAKVKVSNPVSRRAKAGTPASA